MANYTAFRYPIVLTKAMLRGNETTRLELPAGAMFMSVGFANWLDLGRQVQLWYMVDTEAENTKTVEIMVLGTGHFNVPPEVVKRMQFFGTVINQDAEEVYHVFRLHPETPRLAMMAAVETSEPRAKEKAA